MLMGFTLIVNYVLKTRYGSSQLLNRFDPAVIDHSIFTIRLFLPVLIALPPSYNQILFILHSYFFPYFISFVAGTQNRVQNSALIF